MALVHQGFARVVSIPGDGEKCKRVNLRCGEKAFGLRRRETNQGIERKGKRSRELRGRRGKRGNSYRNICSGIPRGIGFQPNPKPPATCQPPAVSDPSSHFSHFSFCHFSFLLFQTARFADRWFPSWDKPHATEDQLLSRGGSLPLSSPRPPGKHRLNVQPLSRWEPAATTALRHAG